MRCSVRSMLVAAVATLGACGGSDSTPPLEEQEAAVVSLRVLPEGAMLRMDNGQGGALDFELEVTLDDGSVKMVAADTWWTSVALLGGIDADGAFQASGSAAGVTEISATYAGETATTSLSVEVAEVIYADGFDPSQADDFADAPQVTADSAALLYPLDGAVIPKSLGPIHVQWQPTSEGDRFRVVLSAGSATVRAYALASAEFDYAWLIDSGAWSLLQESALQSQSPIEVRVDRLDGETLATHASETHSVIQTAANLDGAIYYWDLSEGKILRIVAGERDNPIPYPPAQPAELDKKDGVGGSRCVACHTMSRDGRYMATLQWGGGGYNSVFDLSRDLTVDPAPTTFPTGTFQALFQTFDPSASRLLVNARNASSTGSLELRDPLTGEALPTLGEPLPTTGAAHPTWSPDGSLIAYAANHDGAWSVDYTQSDLAVIPVTEQDTFGASQTLRPSDGMANSWPTFSPDSQWIAYGRGVHSRGRNTDADGNLIVYPGDLRMIHRDGGQEIVLANASGDGENSHLPNFSPFTQDGYYWMIFYSTRDYGNDLAGTAGHDMRQMWIAAIDTNVAPGEDPSMVPFWLPGQKTDSHNMSAYWTLPPPAPIE